MGYASHARVLLEAIIKEGGQNFNKLNDQVSEPMYVPVWGCGAM